MKPRKPFRSTSAAKAKRGISERERKIRAALDKAMAIARGESLPPPSSEKPLNQALDYAVRGAGLEPDERARPIASRERTKRRSAIPPEPQVANPKPVKIPSTKADRAALQEAQMIAAKKRAAEKVAKKNARKVATAQRYAVARALDSAEAAQRLRDRQIKTEKFIENIRSAPFADLIANWKKHIDLIRYTMLTHRKDDRLPLYRRVVFEIESEWNRRSKLPHSTEGYFDWPTTIANKGNGEIEQAHWAEEGVLAYLGYHVGTSSTLVQSQRHAILRRVFDMHLPPIESPTYMQGWGAPGSADRLRKIANSLASFARQAKRRSSFDMTEAVASWEADLAMLHAEYYVGRFNFGWPS